jgi:hypothetical protein
LQSRNLKSQRSSVTWQVLPGVVQSAFVRQAATADAGVMRRIANSVATTTVTTTRVIMTTSLV